MQTVNFPYMKIVAYVCKRPSGYHAFVTTDHYQTRDVRMTWANSYITIYDPFPPIKCSTDDEFLISFW